MYPGNDRRSETFVERLLSFAVVAIICLAFAWGCSGCSAAAKKKPSGAVLLLNPALEKRNVVFRGCQLVERQGDKVSCRCDHISWAVDASLPGVDIAICSNRREEEARPNAGE